uniref:Uncharacterized protein n=1 Tax=Arundo donax TaxID=35708 RepID=A0A0A9GKB6_ARUDO
MATTTISFLSPQKHLFFDYYCCLPLSARLPLSSPLPLPSSRVSPAAVTVRSEADAARSHGAAAPAPD